MSQYLISICIPTYNRAPYLKKCLDSLVCQPEFQQGLVEIVISDNASTDGTAELVKRYQSRYDDIRYFRNEKNYGFQNLGFAVARATGIFRKLSNDTLQFDRDSLRHLCKISEKYQNSRPIVSFGNGILAGGELLELEDPNKYFEDISFYITWIGTFSLWGEDCDDVIESAKRSKSDLWHVEYVLQRIREGRKFVIFNRHIMDVQTLKKKNISYGLFRVFYNNYLGMVNQLRQEDIITNNCFAYLKKDILFRFFTRWIILWEDDRKTYMYSNDENLKDLIFNAYKKETYFPKFLQHYQRMQIQHRIKSKIKLVPFLGKVLIMVKHFILK